LPGLYLIPDYLNVRITLEDDHFEYRNILRDIYEVPYECIHQYKETGRILIETDERKIKLSYWTMVGIGDLLEKLNLHVNGEQTEAIKMSRTERNIYYTIFIACLTISLLMQGLYYGANLGTREETWLLLTLGIVSLGIVLVAFIFSWFFEKTYNIFFRRNGFTWETGFTRVWGTINAIPYADITQCKIGKFFIILHTDKKKHRFFKAKMLHGELMRHGVV